MAIMHFLAKDKATADAIQKKVIELVGGYTTPHKPPVDSKDGYHVMCEHIPSDKVDLVRNAILEEFKDIQVRP